MTTAQSNHYSQLSTEYLSKARIHLAEDNLKQALRTGWEAVATTLKVGAQSRGLPHDRHRDLWVVVRTLIREYGDTELRLHFGCVQTMYINFYDVPYDRDDIEWYLDHVERLVDKLDELA